MEHLAAVAGTGNRLYFMPEWILELGPVGESYLPNRSSSMPGPGQGSVERLFMLLDELGEPSCGCSSGPSSRGQVLHDGDLAEAILDRVLERRTHFTLRGSSYRTSHLKKEEPTTHTGAA
ncbi:MAG TPA: hypothetical protein VE173_06945 [Longimicrobiales bacterium]|nr:hypothetical protein [Longimicrobiales bacterium]